MRGQAQVVGASPSHCTTAPLTYAGWVQFEWDPAKNLASVRKHGLDFGEVFQVFESETECLDIFDEEHSVLEERVITIGPVRRGVVLVVWTERELDIRQVVGARGATVLERELYQRHMEQ
jgi:uncharacterized protein